MLILVDPCKSAEENILNMAPVFSCLEKIDHREQLISNIVLIGANCDLWYKEEYNEKVFAQVHKALEKHVAAIVPEISPKYNWNIDQVINQVVTVFLRQTLNLPTVQDPQPHIAGKKKCTIT